MSAQHKVLVVDDDPVVRQSFDRVLSGKGYAVITAESGEEALRKLGEEKYDAVYTDIRMPGMSGLDLAEQVRARKPWTPVVIITGFGSDAAEARAKAAGVTSFLQKPLSPETIESSASSILSMPAVAEAVAAPAAAPTVAPVEETAGSVGRGLLNIALFFAAPFIGLAYFIALPFVGGVMLAKIAYEAASKNAKFNTTMTVFRHLGMIGLAPVIGLVFFITLPLVGLAALLWTATLAVARR